MRRNKNEQIRAQQLSAAIDQIIKDPAAEPGALPPADAGLLDTARRLARLPALLGAPDPALEQQVMRQVRREQAGTRRRAWFKVGWAIAGLAATLLILALVTPLGQTAVASFMSVFNLGRTEVRITPVYTSTVPSATAPAGASPVQQQLSLAQARRQVPFAIPEPGYLPAGYRLHKVISYTYPDLPAWLPQPFFVELVYGDEGDGELRLRLYPIVLGEEGSTQGLNLEASPIQDVQDVAIDGRAGVLLTLGAEGVGIVLQEVVWEQGDLILALSARNLGEAELLRIAGSIE